MESERLSVNSTEGRLLSQAEQRLALDVARGYLDSFLRGNEYILSKKMPRLFRSPVTVGVSFWVHGAFRGSYVSTGKSLVEGIPFVARRAARDARYKPLSIDDLDGLRIQMTLMTGERVLLTKAECENHAILFDNGYVVEYRGKQGWLLPLTFNLVRVRTARELFVLLATKAGISSDLLSDPNTYAYTFLVQDFIEGTISGSVCSLCGPMVCLDSVLDLPGAAAAAADSLLAAQEDDGNFVPILNLLTGEHTAVDWPRCALTGWTLAEYGSACGEQRYIDAAERSASFIGRYLDDVSFVMPDLALTLAYAGQSALRLGRIEQARSYAERIVAMEHITYHPIVFQQIASFLGRISLSTDWTYVRHAVRFAQFVYDDLERAQKKDAPVFLASYAELANTFIILYKCTGNETYLLSARDILQWLARHQLASGAFRGSTHSDEINVRGSGKILEVFAMVKALSEHERDIVGSFTETIDRCTVWIATMQYDARNTFFVRPDLRTRAIGGFRHTLGDPDIWIDSAAHFLLAATRLMHPQPFIPGSSEEPGLLYPLRDARMLLSDTSVDRRFHSYFFGKRFALERVAAHCIHAASRFIGQADRNLRESLPFSVERNDLLRNYGYVYNHLVCRGILVDHPFDMLVRYKWFSDAPGFFDSNPELRSIAAVSDGSDASHTYAHGFSTQWNVSVGQAIGEVLERYPYRVYRHTALMYGSTNDFLKQNKRIILPDQLAVFSVKQKQHFPARQWNDNSSLYWETVSRISTGESFLVPAQVVYWNYQCVLDEPRLRESNTSGLGGGFCFERAALSALYELIERDAFFVHWLNGLAPIRIDPGTVPDAPFQDMYRDAVQRGFELIVLYAPTEAGIPVFFTIIHDPRETGPCYVLGGGCNVDPIRALNRSFEEAWSIYYWSRSVNRDQYGSLPQVYDPFITPLSIDQRISVWSNHAMKGKLDFFIGRHAVDYSVVAHHHSTRSLTAKEELRHVIHAVESIGEGYEVYIHQNNHPILASVGYYAVRVIVPKFVPMYYREENAPIEISRIKTFGSAYGSADGFINSLPHLFP